MRLVDQHWPREGIAGAALQPLLVAPGVAAQVGDDRGRGRADLGGEAVGVGLVHLVAADLRADVELVSDPRLQAGDEQFPDAPFAAPAQRVATRIPLVEVADHRYPAGMRGPE